MVQFICILLLLPCFLNAAESGPGRHVSGDTQNGVGVMVWDNGARYEGAFVNGLPHGRGVYTYDDGDTYTGEFLRGERHGEGVYVWHTGARYEGHFRNGKRFGKGTMRYSDGRTFSGTWGNNEPQSGKMTFPDGREYSGEFNDAMPHGKGYMTNPEGLVQFGTFKEGTLETLEREHYRTRFLTLALNMGTVPENFNRNTQQHWDFSLGIGLLLNAHKPQRILQHYLYIDFGYATGESSNDEFIRLHYRPIFQINDFFSVGADIGFYFFGEYIFWGSNAAIRFSRYISAGIVLWFTKEATMPRLGMELLWHL